MRIAFFDTKSYDHDFFSRENKKYQFEIEYIKPHLTEQTAPLAQGCEVVCAFVNDTLNAKVIDILYQGGTRLIAMRCAGYNNIDLEAAKGKLKIVRVPSYSPHAVAEHALALMLTLNRKLHRAYMRVRENNFSLEGLLGFDMLGKTVGIIGAGEIGKIAASIMHGIGMRVLCYDVVTDPNFAKEEHITYVDLDTLYRESDIISLHCPLTPETHYIINAKAIDKMKPGAMVINTGRGLLINTKDLIEGLKSGKISAAGLDVYEEEGEIFFEDLSYSFITDDTLARLQTFPNVIITSHQGFFTREALHNITTTTFDNISCYLNNRPLQNEVA